MINNLIVLTNNFYYEIFQVHVKFNVVFKKICQKGDFYSVCITVNDNGFLKNNGKSIAEIPAAICFIRIVDKNNEERERN